MKSMQDRQSPSNITALSALQLVGMLGLLVAGGTVLGLGLGELCARVLGHGVLFRAGGILLGLMAGLGAAITRLLKEVPWTK